MQTKSFFLALALLAASMGGYAQKPTYKKVGLPDAQGWTVVTEKKKFGYIDSMGSIVVPIVYDRVEPYVGNYVCVQKGKKWGFLNREGKEAVPPIYDEIEPFGMFSPDLSQVNRGGKWGIIDTLAKEVIPALYEKIVFDEGLAPLKGNGKVGFIDHECNMVIPAVYDDCTYFRYGSVAVKQNGRWGYIDREGNMIVPMTLNYDQVGTFSEDLIAVRQNKKWGFIDASGNVVIPVNLNYNEAFSFSDGMARVRKGKKYGFINKTGKAVISAKYVGASDFQNGVTIASDVNRTGMWLAIAVGGAQGVAAAASYVEAQTAQTAMETQLRYGGGNVDEAYKWRQNQMIIQQNFNNDLQRANQNAQRILQSSGGGKVFQLGMIDKSGKTLIPFKYASLTLDTLSGNFYLLSGQRVFWDGSQGALQYGIFDMDKKKVVIPADYNNIDITTFAEKEWILVSVIKGIFFPTISFGIIDYSGKVIIPVEHRLLGKFDAAHERIWVGDMDKAFKFSYGVIDYSGKVIIPKTAATNIELIDNAFVMTINENEKRYFDLDGREIRK